MNLTRSVPAPLRVSILGASGYSGAELLRLLLTHPRVTVDRLFANSSAGRSVADVLPAFARRIDKTFETFTPDAIRGSDLVFLALPSGEAMNLVPSIVDVGKRVIDLGGDFRLTEPAQYATYYKRTHTATALLGRSVYGLPEWNAPAIRTASLVANPGCYPTSVILPLVPLVKAGLIAPAGIVANSLSGVSGAGRSASADMSFGEVNESVRAYKVGVHQHIPEIEQAVGQFSGSPATVTFVPHLLPTTRGIYTTITATLQKSATADEVHAVFASAYGNAPFVRLLSGIPEIKYTTMTNFIDIGFQLYERNHQLLVFSTIDNLLKGAAGQAVQNMNLMFGFDETEGLL